MNLDAEINKMVAGNKRRLIMQLDLFTIIVGLILIAAILFAIYLFLRKRVPSAGTPWRNEEISSGSSYVSQDTYQEPATDQRFTDDPNAFGQWPDK
jgi:hypothetical protein